MQLVSGFLFHWDAEVSLVYCSVSCGTASHNYFHLWIAVWLLISWEDRDWGVLHCHFIDVTLLSLSTFIFFILAPVLLLGRVRKHWKEMNYYYNWCLFICNTFPLLFCLSLSPSSSSFSPSLHYFSFLPVQWEQKSCLHSSLLSTLDNQHITR